LPLRKINRDDLSHGAFDRQAMIVTLDDVYLNETGSCFYLIRNREFFSFMKTIDPDVKILNKEIDIGINISLRD
jgi:hypothetical protein